jgi:predicted dehydrogenase
MDSSREPLGMAVLGCGRAAASHAKVVRRVAPTVALHFASRDPERASRFAREHVGRGAFGSYEAAIESDAVRLVLITTPPDSHLELTLAALAAGKSVVVEKPAFLQPEDFEAVRNAADGGARVFVAENYFYKPLRRRLSELIARGTIGEPLLLNLNAVKRQRPEGWRADPGQSGGGGLFEGGIHWVNLVSNLGMEPVRVTGRRAGRGGSAEESLVLVAEYDNGAVGTLQFSWEVPSPLQGVRLSTLYGREGSAWFESNGIFLLARGRRTRFSLPGFRDIGGFRGMWTDFLEALRTGREPEMTLDLAERDVRIVRDVYRSLDDRR